MVGYAHDSSAFLVPVGISYQAVGLWVPCLLHYRAWVLGSQDVGHRLLTRELLGHRAAPGHRSRVGKHSLRWGTAGASSGVLEPANRPGLPSSQVLGHPGAAGFLRRAENGVEVQGWPLAWG